MEVIVAQQCGFCHGVRNAINIAEQILTEHKEVYSLGPIIHNRDMVDKLAKAGLKTVEDADEIKSGTVLIRSHGASPEQIAGLKAKGFNIADATCVLVKRVQQIAQQLGSEGYKVIIIGDKNHPEIQAVVKCAKDVVVIAQESDLKAIPKDEKLGVICQTTESPEHCSKMLGAVAKKDFRELKVINTLCKEAIKRQDSAVQLCRQVDVMFVLGGLESAKCS